MTVEWNAQFHGERRQLFSHAGRIGRIEGQGVDIKSLAGGDATYTIPYTKATSKGSYICSVSVPPVFASVEISLLIEGKEMASLVFYCCCCFFFAKTGRLPMSVKQSVEINFIQVVSSSKNDFYFETVRKKIK